MKLIIDGAHSIENLLVGMTNGRQGGLSHTEAIVLVKAIEHWENANGITFEVGPNDLISAATFCNKASDVFDIDPDIDPADFLDFCQSNYPYGKHSNVYGTADGYVIKTHNPHIPFVWFSHDIYFQAKVYDVDLYANGG